MTLRALGLKAGLKLKEPVALKEEDAALIFVLNRSYLIGLKALAYSMLEHKTLLDLPVIVLSEEQDLAEDKFVHAIADNFIAINGEDIAQFSSIPSGRIDARVRLDWIPKYTHLKWMMYDDYGFQKLIWIDTDIICTGNINHLLTLNDAELYAGSVFSQSLYLDENKEKKPQSTRDENIWGFSTLTQRPNDKLNTGVMVVNAPLLQASFRQELISIAKEAEHVNEQQVVSKAMRRHGATAAGWLTPWDNYNHGYVRYCSEPVQRRLLDNIRLLHYVGANGKPWDKRDNDKKTIRLWWEYYDRAKSINAIFA